jgi:hypothetical protein
MKAYAILFRIVQRPATTALFIEHVTVHAISLEAIANGVLHISFMADNFGSMELTYEVNVVIRFQAVANWADYSPEAK